MTSGKTDKTFHVNKIHILVQVIFNFNLMYGYKAWLCQVNRLTKFGIIMNIDKIDMILNYMRN